MKSSSSLSLREPVYSTWFFVIDKLFLDWHHSTQTNQHYTRSVRSCSFNRKFGANCEFLRLPSWHVIRISSSGTTQGRWLPGTWPPWSPLYRRLCSFSSLPSPVSLGTTVVFLVWVMTVAAKLLPLRVVSDVASIIMALLIFSMDAALTMLPPIWRINDLPTLTGHRYVQTMVCFHIPLMMVGSINFLPLTLPLKDHYQWGDCPSSDARCRCRHLGGRRVGMGHHHWRCCTLRVAPNVGWADPSRPPASPCINVDLFRVDFGVERSWDLSHVPPPGFINIPLN